MRRLKGDVYIPDPRRLMARLEQVFEFHFRDPYEVALYGSEASGDCPPSIVVGPQTHRRAQLIV